MSYEQFDQPETTQLFTSAVNACWALNDVTFTFDIISQFDGDTSLN